MLGIERAAPSTWREAWPSPLWAYHVHYHDGLADLAWAARASGDASLTARLSADLATWHGAWGSGGTPAWDPYPIAVRTVNWVRILGWLGFTAVGTLDLATSLARQLDVLRRSLEWHLDGNHLLRDAWALAIAPWLLDDPLGDHWARDGAALYWTTFLEQVPEDGVHCERSPMYHARVLRDTLEVLAVQDAVGAPVPSIIRDRVRRMQDALAWLRHPDGTLRLLQDSAGDHGVDLDAIAGTPDASATWFAPAARYAGVRDPLQGDALLVDFGGPAPVHQPGHAHAGALGFELDVDGYPCLVDAGCSGYDGDPWRAWLRGTAAHNTVQIAGAEQSEMWATFRVARRAVVTMQPPVHTPEAWHVDGTARGYATPRAVHERRITRRARAVILHDRVREAAGMDVVGRLHCAPEWTAIDGPAPATAILQRGATRVEVRVSGATLSLVRGQQVPPMGWRAVRFGDVRPAWALEVRPTDPAGGWETTITPVPT
jgi:uncharacterized heparinase superfamily protein